MLLETEKCMACDEKSDTLFKCSICGELSCPACDKTKICIMCDRRVCSNCIAHSDTSDICESCFRDLFITYENYKSLTKAIDKALTEATENAEKYGEVWGFGFFKGSIQAIKTQYEF